MNQFNIKVVVKENKAIIVITSLIHLLIIVIEKLL
jgi:hypothetical protein